MDAIISIEHELVDFNKINICFIKNNAKTLSEMSNFIEIIIFLITCDNVVITV